MTQRKLTALTAAAVCIVTSMYSFHISTDRIGAVKSALNENDTRAQEPAKTTTLSSTVIGPGLQKFTTYTSMDNSFPEFVKREENVYTLLPAAWSNQSSLSTYPEGACNKASYWKFDRHGCCPSETSLELRQLSDNFTTHLLLEEWRNKHVWFWGDSITQQMIDALLNNADAEQIHNVVLFHPPVDNGTALVFFEDYNVTIHRIGHGGGGISTVGSERLPITYGNTPLEFEKSLAMGDIFYVNFGLHLTELTQDQGQTMFGYVRRILELALKQNPEKQFFYRLTFPQHFIGPDGLGGDYRDRESDECVNFGTQTSEHWTSVLAKQVFLRSNVTVLDYNQFLSPRGDLHSLHNKGDCSHWCWDYHMWRGIFFLMYAALLDQNPPLKRGAATPVHSSNINHPNKGTDDLIALRQILRPEASRSSDNPCSRSIENRSCYTKRKPSLPFVSGDTFRCLADIIFDETNNYQPYAEDIACLQYLKSQSNFQEPYVVFVKTDMLNDNNPDTLMKIDNVIPGNYIIVSHNSDFSVSSDLLRQAKTLPKLVHWYGQNIEGGDIQTTIPIGLSNHHWGVMHPKYYTDIPDIPKRLLATANFNPRNSERKVLLDKLQSLSWVDTPGFGYLNKNASISNHETWLRQQAEYKFAFSPVGNGIDCHRTWEMILIGVIPIIRSTAIDSVFGSLRDKGAVLIVDDWSQVNQSLLESHWAKYGDAIAHKSKHQRTIAGSVIEAEYWVRLFSHQMDQSSNLRQVSTSTFEFQHTNYVVFSSTIDIFARGASYDYLVPLVARNWFLQGFVPIVFIVADDSQKIEMARNLWGPIMPNDALVVPIVAASEIAITVAQIARLYAAKLVPEVPDEAFLRITDADMMIMDNQPFLPTQQFLHGKPAVTIFNGRCCLRKNEYPMHSVGMKFSLWRQLFPMPMDTSNATKVIMNIVTEAFNISTANPVKHGGKGWNMDQVFLARVINRFGQIGQVDLAPGPQKRLHINGKWADANDANSFTDVHLAGFSLAAHHQWLAAFVTEADALKGFIEPYTSYTERYALAHNISLTV